MHRRTWGIGLALMNLRFFKSRQPDTPNPPSRLAWFLLNNQATDHDNLAGHLRFWI
jgi:hypothetical protein